ncbi:CU044_2847 family protein [Fusibacter ferrireducens]|uniref:Trypsin-co-occurring domain-containing protein n=1 Tax=Fusibacter ferrireducens TaxID=2785058 RepID=A0ABR9ZNL5_9FIRM|nr:CU044_2847 family protein [Fusibacter ferrireducens]MBF4692063.1 hypothetical protein [Fusibacter ferrireducens]
MNKEIIRLKDGVLVEIEKNENFSQVSNIKTRMVDITFDSIKDTLTRISKPISEMVEKDDSTLKISKTEVELGLSFQGEGNIYITKIDATANLKIKMTFEKR